MDLRERQFVMGQLASSEARLLELVEGLTQEQWRFRETPQRWSIAENLEHCIVFERFIRGKIATVLDEGAEPEKKTAAAAKEPLVLGLAKTRDIKFTAREAVRPVGQWADTDELMAAFRGTRAETLAFVAETQAELRDYFFPHIVFGDLDCYQWVVVLGQHTLRHSLQIEEIKADARYPIF